MCVWMRTQETREVEIERRNNHLGARERTQQIRFQVGSACYLNWCLHVCVCQRVERERWNLFCLVTNSRDGISPPDARTSLQPPTRPPLHANWVSALLTKCQLCAARNQLHQLSVTHVWHATEQVMFIIERLSALLCTDLLLVGSVLDRNERNRKRQNQRCFLTN